MATRTIAQLNATQRAVVRVERASVLAPGGARTLAATLEERPSLFLLSPTVDDLYGGAIRQRLDAVRPPSEVCVVPTGESNKNQRTVGQILELAKEMRFSRDGVFVGVGGGVLLDMVGLAASLYRRGISHVKVGTTVLAQVDAGVGVKCGVNLDDAKNLIGSFYPPEAVLVDGGFLRTVSSRDVRCGLAEMVKLAIISDGHLFDLMERHGAALLDESRRDSDEARVLIDRAIASMVAELSRDVYEEDLRRRVDFGHTISPTLEARSGYELPHGEAVSVDLALFSVVARLAGLLPSEDFDRIIALMDALQLPHWHHGLLSAGFLDEALTSTRAHRGGHHHLPMPTGIGSATSIEDVAELPARALEEALERLRPSGSKVGG